MSIVAVSNIIPLEPCFNIIVAFLVTAAPLYANVTLMFEPALPLEGVGVYLLAAAPPNSNTHPVVDVTCIIVEFGIPLVN